MTDGPGPDRDSALALLDEVTFPKAAGGYAPPAAPVQFRVLRPLTPADVPTLLAKAPSGAGADPVATIRQSHHNLARLLATGVDDVEASLCTGYTPNHISRLRQSPAFAELLNYYSTQRDQIFVDALERMKVVGLMAIDELRQRIEDEPSAFARRELMEVVDLMLVKSQQLAPTRAGAAGLGAPAGVNVAISFVQAKPQEPPSVTIDQRPTESQE